MIETSTIARMAVATVAAAMLAGCATPIRVSCAPLRTHFATRVPDMDIIAAIRDDSRVPSQNLFGAEALKEIATKSSLGLATQQQILNAQRLPLAWSSAPLNLIQGDGQGQPRGPNKADAREATPVYLMLSGGGQWGAYGAAFLEALGKNDGNVLPRADFVTGVSTGGLQALYVGAHQAAPDKGWLTKLRTQYSPASESDIVNRGSWLGAALKGSVAKLAPLRSRIEDALCPGAKKLPANAELDEASCPLIAALADDDAPQVLLGFVEADSGDLMFVSVNQIAKGSYRVADLAQSEGVGTAQLSMRDRQQCLAGAALASAAVPVQYQQLQIISERPEMGPHRQGLSPTMEAKTYMDGGVRQSVFFALPRALTEYLIGEHSTALSRSAGTATEKARKIDLPGTAYIIRNGPTVALRNDEADTSADAFTAAMRGYALMVNQSEVASIAAMRLIWPSSTMQVTSADAYDKPFTDPDPAAEGKENTQREWAGCQSKMTKVQGEMLKDAPMFNPDFMKCLRAFGRFKAMQPILTSDAQRANVQNSWIELPKTETKPKE